MQRRTFLEAGAGASVALTLLSAPVSGATRALESASGAEDANSIRPPSQSQSQSQSTDAYEPLGRLEIEGAAEAVVGDDGETVYLATVDGFAIVDVSDPTDPTFLAERRGLLGGSDDGDSDDDETTDGGNGDEDETYGPLTDILDVEVDGDRLIVPGPANSTRGNEFHGFAMYDVGDPTDPVLAAEPYETDFHIHNCFFEDDLCYLVGNGVEGNPLVIVDVSDDEPTEVGRWSLLEYDDRWADVNPILRYLHDVYVHDGVAYLPYWNAGTYLVDVSDPDDPEYISHVADDVDVESQRGLESFAVTEAQQTLPGNDHYSAVDETGELLGVGRESWAAERGETEGAGGIDLWDISDRTAPEYLSTIEAPESFDASYRGGMWTTAHNFELRDGRLYSSWYHGGVKIHDVSDPTSPEELAWWRDPADTAFWTARVAEPGETFVASSTPAIPNSPAAGALYVFPIESGTQADPPSLTDPEESGRSVELDDEGPGTDTETETETETEDENDSEANSSATDESDEEATPGFTGITGVSGGALALEWLRRSRSSGSSGSSPESDSDSNSNSNLDSPSESN